MLQAALTAQGRSSPGRRKYTDYKGTEVILLDEMLEDVMVR